MLFFKKEPEVMPATGKGFLPTDRIKELSSKGFSEPEMIDILRKEGFSPEEIDKGLTEALKSGVIGPQKPTETPTPVATPAPTAPTPSYTEPVETPKLPTLEELTPKATEPVIPQTSLPAAYSEGYSPEEYLDYVLRERMAEIDDRISEFMRKYGEVEKKMAEIHEQLSLLSKARVTEEQLLMSKIDSFRESIDDVSARINSLEKAFKETLPALIESVRALSDLVQRLKKEA